jgi:hypothetical protein
LLVNFRNPYFEALARPFTLKMLRAKECAVTISRSTVFTFRFTIESIKELGGASSLVKNKKDKKSTKAQKSP